ncbi:hypothetical protein J3E64_002351 [Sphingobium sp. OAS761]|uniref:hypothetical protein n=1 Tax=Sphingobium sp. OAS761 TaxID=2817901 RepID=UPI00209DBCFC|nr:hypothetical protein [Sphingobium sp. OAS761]MCP1470663.1 hypothetical protein [Sphingobium sp. OAS761]
MAKFIVHIGDGKCGSSAMQAAMFDARTTLKEQGFLYKSHHRTSGNFCLGTLLGKSTRGNNARQREFALQTIAQLSAELDDVDYVLVSSEAFLTLDPEEVVEILQMITLDIERIDVIAYVRDPLGMYLSLAQQSIKASYRFPRPDTYVRPLDRFLDKFQSYPMIDSVTVRMFDRSQLVKANAVADFEHVICELTGKEGLGLEHINENTSLSSEQMVVLQDYRAKFCRDIDGKAAPGSSRLIDFMMTMNENGLVGNKPTLSSDAAALVAQGNADIIDRLNRLYGFTLRCDRPEVGSIPAERSWSHISNILTDVQPGYVHHIKMLVPAFNPALEAGDMEKGLKSMHKLIELEPSKAEAIERATKIYWTTESIAGLVSS